ncbi:MAG: hypothetical protein U1F68_02710 [Gammaproteobacteria bacterium]
MTTSVYPYRFLGKARYSIALLALALVGACLGATIPRPAGADTGALTLGKLHPGMTVAEVQSALEADIKLSAFTQAISKRSVLKYYWSQIERNGSIVLLFTRPEYGQQLYYIWYKSSTFESLKFKDLMLQRFGSPTYLINEKIGVWIDGSTENNFISTSNAYITDDIVFRRSEFRRYRNPISLVVNWASMNASAYLLDKDLMEKICKVSSKKNKASRTKFLSSAIALSAR